MAGATYRGHAAAPPRAPTRPAAFNDMMERAYPPRAMREPLLRIPPFPGARVPALMVPVRTAPERGEDIGACMAALREARVGGTFWATRPAIDAARTIVARPASAAQARAMIAAARAEGCRDRLLFWLPRRIFRLGSELRGFPVIHGDCDPWALIDQVERIWLDAGDPFALLARIGGRQVRTWGDGVFAGLAEAGEDKLTAWVASFLVDGVCYRDPFSGKDIGLSAAIDLLEYWRRLIDANRPIAAAAGFARWKRATVAPLLWNGTDPVRFISPGEPALSSLPTGSVLALWKSKVPDAFLSAVAEKEIAVREVEDGFIRSSGLGANCVPPLSITVDRLGVHFDPAQASELETLLETATFPAELLDRADRLRQMIRATGLSKYDVGGDAMDRPGGDRRHVLVPGQVEDDRSVLSGGGGVGGNLGLLRRAREMEPDAFILYKPHPDVEAGHRKGRIPEGEAERLADMVVRDAPISALLDMVDTVHVMTSLAGFEALVRGKPVVAHGVPFYAGWGLTTDLGPVPSRRTRRRNVLELIAAVLLLYPRYLDPATRLPCPPEILVERLVAGVRRHNGAVVAFRRLQGNFMRLIMRGGIA